MEGGRERSTAGGMIAGPCHHFRDAMHLFLPIAGGEPCWTYVRRQFQRLHGVALFSGGDELLRDLAEARHSSLRTVQLVRDSNGATGDSIATPEERDLALLW